MAPLGPVRNFVNKVTANIFAYSINSKSQGPRPKVLSMVPSLGTQQIGLLPTII